MGKEKDQHNTSSDVMTLKNLRGTRTYPSKNGAIQMCKTFNLELTRENYLAVAHPMEEPEEMDPAVLPEWISEIPIK